MDYTTNQPQSTQNYAVNVASQNVSHNYLADEKVDITTRTTLLKARLDAIVLRNEKAGITTSVILQDLKSGQMLYNHSPQKEHFAASINKLPVALLLVNDIRSKKLSPDATVSWNTSDVRAGLGTYDQADAPTSATVRELLTDMLNKSGNTAVRVLVNKSLGGADVTNQRIKSELKLYNTALQPTDISPQGFYLGNTNATDAKNTLDQLLKKSTGNTKFVSRALTTNIYTDYGVHSQLAGNNYISLANKVGILDDTEEDNRHDVGIIYNRKTQRSYTYSLFTTTPHVADDNVATQQANDSIAEIGREILRYGGDKPKQ